MSSPSSKSDTSTLRRILRWLLIAVATLVVLLALAALTITLISRSRAKRTYPVQPVAYTMYSSDEDIAEGERLAQARSCASCHGDNLAGRVASDELPVMRLVGTNLTGGAGSAIRGWSDEDIARIIRYGVRPDGKPAFFMPAHEYFSIPERELGQLIG